ncbi:PLASMODESMATA CALLOSE-BINDING PROTEIN 1 [Argentina anserina]|uniref:PLASMODESMATA CALLOSE-BINDING PROTEIN 1 n=1 Tax=Argentina anserina TaxID=57926 RepID=UPI0021768EA9|nr:PLASMODESMATA CALLOSE-BINDING PROTEIN 1 [Potentilla anserina]
MAAVPPSLFLFFLLTTTLVGISTLGAEGAPTTWCVTRSDASNQALQTALDYACASGADCVPIQPDGLCYLPNTIQAHTSYAFNSFYQRKAMAPGSCDFSGTATVAQTDPSYGSCVYPSSVSTAGGTSILTPNTTPVTTTTVPSPPTTMTNPTFGNGVVGGLTPVTTPPVLEDSKAVSLQFMLSIFIAIFFIFCLVF